MILFRILLKIPYVKNHPNVLKLDKWLEKKIGIDIIKQEKKWFEKLLKCQYKVKYSLESKRTR